MKTSSKKSLPSFGPCFSDKELKAGKPKRRRISEAQAYFQDFGLTMLHNALPRDLVVELKRAYFEHYGGLSEDELRGMGSRVGHERWMLSLPFQAPFDRPDLYAPKLVYPLIQRLLGDDFVLQSYSAVTAFPGAEHQHVHRDHELLYPEDEPASFSAPAYAVTVAIPLIDLDETCGGTSVWPKTHAGSLSLMTRMKKPVPVRPQMGSVYVMDYRLLHGGEPNTGHVPRPILYLVYARPWFKDACNFNAHPPLRAGDSAFEDVPQPLRHLFVHDPAGSLSMGSAAAGHSPDSLGQCNEV